MIAACLEAQHRTGDTTWAEQARWAFNWFVGENQLELALYDPRTGGCRDGLHADRVNENQGAESSLCFLRLPSGNARGASCIRSERRIRAGSGAAVFPETFSACTLVS